MIILTVLAEDINFAKNQIKKFEKTKNGSFTLLKMALRTLQSDRKSQLS